MTRNGVERDTQFSEIFPDTAGVLSLPWRGTAIGADREPYRGGRNIDLRIATMSRILSNAGCCRERSSLGAKPATDASTLTIQEDVGSRAITEDRLGLGPSRQGLGGRNRPRDKAPAVPVSGSIDQNLTRRPAVGAMFWVAWKPFANPP